MNQMTEEQIILERKHAKEAMDRFFRQQGDFRTEKECRHDWKKNNFLTQAEAEKKITEILAIPDEIWRQQASLFPLSEPDDPINGHIQTKEEEIDSIKQRIMPDVFFENPDIPDPKHLLYQASGIKPKEESYTEQKRLFFQMFADIGILFTKDAFFVRFGSCIPKNRQVKAYEQF